MLSRVSTPTRPVRRRADVWSRAGRQWARPVRSPPAAAALKRASVRPNAARTASPPARAAATRRAARISVRPITGVAASAAIPSTYGGPSRRGAPLEDQPAGLAVPLRARPVHLGQAAGWRWRPSARRAAGRAGPSGRGGCRAGGVSSTRMWVQPSARAAWIGIGWVMAASQKRMPTVDERLAADDGHPRAGVERAEQVVDVLEVGEADRLDVESGPPSAPSTCDASTTSRRRTAGSPSKSSGSCRVSTSSNRKSRSTMARRWKPRSRLMKRRLLTAS